MSHCEGASTDKHYRLLATCYMCDDVAQGRIVLQTAGTIASGMHESRTPLTSCFAERTLCARGDFCFCFCFGVGVVNSERLRPGCRSRGVSTLGLRVRSWLLQTQGPTSAMHMGKYMRMYMVTAARPIASPTCAFHPSPASACRHAHTYTRRCRARRYQQQQQPRIHANPSSAISQQESRGPWLLPTAPVVQ